jgi:glycosyltransferase involved in cell wall biosynthesis
MKISVIMPLYNAQAYVSAAIDSILAQTLPPAEIVVVDDESTDRSAEMVASYGPPVSLLRQAHAVPASGLNRGIAATSGDAIAFLDADDLWVKDKLEMQVEVLAAKPEIDAVFGLIQQFGAADTEDRFQIPREPQRGVSRIGALIRRAAFDRLGPFDPSLRVAEFVPWYARAAALGLRTAMIDRVVAYRRIHADNSGIVRRKEQQQESLLGLKQALDLRRRQRAGESSVSPEAEQPRSQD